MKKLTCLLGVVVTLAAVAPALAVDGSSGPNQLAAAIFAPRDNGDDTDTNPPPVDDPVTDPVDDSVPADDTAPSDDSGSTS